MKKILLGDEVMVSDPGYAEPVWCQKKLTGVLPGYYSTFCKLYHLRGPAEKSQQKLEISYRVHPASGLKLRGSLPTMLLVVHEDYERVSLAWERLEGVEIGVDSGNAGIFSYESFRDDDHSELQERPAPLAEFHSYWVYDDTAGYMEPGDKFYDLMCGLTGNTVNSWGAYDRGVVSRSGSGDGSYDLFIARNGDEQIVGICIDFCEEDEEDFNLDFYKDPGLQ
jgi:hypothetical protein